MLVIYTRSRKYGVPQRESPANIVGVGLVPTRLEDRVRSRVNTRFIPTMNKRIRHRLTLDVFGMWCGAPGLFTGLRLCRDAAAGASQSGLRNFARASAGTDRETRRGASLQHDQVRQRAAPSSTRCPHSHPTLPQLFPVPFPKKTDPRRFPSRGRVSGSQPDTSRRVRVVDLIRLVRPYRR